MDAIRRSIVKSMILLPATAVVRPLVAQETSDLNWRRRFLVPSFSLPVWARNAPERLLYASTERGTWELYAWDRKTDVRRLVTAMGGSLASRNAQLDPNGEWIWWFEDTDGDELGRWVVEPFTGGERRAAMSDIPPAHHRGLAVGSSLAVVGVHAPSQGGDPTVYLVRADEPPRVLYQHHSAAVSSLSHDEKLVCVRFIPASGQGVGVRVLNLRGEQIAELHDGPGRNLRPINWSPRAGDQRLLLMHRRRDMPRPLLWSPETGAEVEIPVDLPGEVTASWYPDASALLIVHDHRGRSELYRLALGDGALERIETERGWIFNSHARVRPNGDVWYGQWSNAATPRQLRAGRGELLPPRGPRAPVGVPYSEHDIDGVPVFLAEPRSARPHPTIFMVHGGPASHDSDYFRPDVQAWVDHGFAVVLVNYRGSTGYGRDWQNAIIGNPGLTELEDIAKVRNWVVAERIAEPKRIILNGVSWGGYLVLLGLGRQPELWSLGIAIAPVAGDYVIAYHEQQLESGKASDRFIFGGSPDEIPEVYRERSPITYVGNVQVPVMIIAGEYDPRSPIRSIEVYVERLRALGKPHQFYRWPAGHTPGEPQEQVRHLEMQIEFAARSLGTRAPL